ncbi:MAG: RNA repair domain-containing protein [Methanomassiliicoccales archaeon]|nr:RNA repair domain-containing protein [Methanomassiliicoccales archaeon]
MAFPREILNELKWRKDRNLAEAEIHYLHRGAPNNIKIISGSEIKELGRYFFSVGDSEVPYHRIRKIIYRGEILFDSSSLGKKEKK